MSLPFGPPENIQDPQAAEWMGKLYRWIISPQSADGPNFLQAGTGAVTRTAQSKLRDFPSVKDFGATGDGTTDDRSYMATADTNAVGCVYYPPGTYLVGSNITLTKPIVMAPGAKFSIANGVTLTLNCSVSAKLHQIFSWAGTGKVLFGNGKIDLVYPEWWGASVDNAAAANSAPLQAWLDAVMDSTYGPRSYLQPGTYSYDTRLNIDFAQGVYISGVGGYWTPSDAGYGSVNVTILYYTGTDEAILIDGTTNNATGFLMECIYVKGTADAAGGININTAAGMKFRDMTVGKFTKNGGFGIKQVASQLNIFDAVGLVDNYYGVFFSGFTNVKNTFKDCVWHSNVAGDFYDTGSFQTVFYDPTFQNGKAGSILISIGSGDGTAEGMTLYNPYFEGGASTTDSYIIDVTGDASAAANYYQHFRIVGGSYSGSGAHDLGFCRMRYTKRASFHDIQFNTFTPSPVFTVSGSTNLFMSFYGIDPTMAASEFEDGSGNPVYWPTFYQNGKTNLVQRDTGDATAVLTLRHLANAGVFADYQGTSEAGVSKNITTWTTGGAIAGFKLVKINGTSYWEPFYTAPTS